MKYIDAGNMLINCEHIVIFETHRRGDLDWILTVTLTVKLVDPIKDVQSREMPVHVASSFAEVNLLYRLFLKFLEGESTIFSVSEHEKGFPNYEDEVFALFENEETLLSLKEIVERLKKEAVYIQIAIGNLLAEESLVKEKGKYRRCDHGEKPKFPSGDE